MTMRTMELTLNEVLFQRLERAARPAGLSVSELVLQPVSYTHLTLPTIYSV